MPTDRERISNINLKLHALARQQHGLAWDGKKRRWVPPDAKTPVDKPDPDDEPVIDEPVEDDPVVPEGDYWAQTAKARSNRIGVNLGAQDPGDTSWPWENLLAMADWRNPAWGYSDPPDIANEELLLNFGQDMPYMIPAMPWTFDAAGGSPMNNTLPTTITGSNVELKIGPGTISTGATLISAWESEGGFHKLFLDRLAPVAGTLRFMDWQRTNTSTKRNWSDENMQSPWYSEHGIPLKRMIGLCNTLGSWPHFCIPHLATDSYVRSFCQFIKANLDSRLKAIIELSNETWEGSHPATWFFGNAANYAARARQVMQIVKEELPDSWRLIGTQEDNIGVTDQVLSGDTSMFTHLTVGFYLGYWQMASASTPSDPLKILENARNDIPRSVASLQQHKARADAKGLGMVGYEGGLSLIGAHDYVDAYYPRFKAANRHPLAGTIEQEHRAAVGPLFDLIQPYTFCGRDNKWGCWGVLPWIGAELATAHRYNTLKQDAQK